MGATVVLVGDSYDEAQAYAKKRSKEEGRTFVPPFDHPDVIIGQGTVGMEIVRQFLEMKSKGTLHAIFVPVGGGGLIAGIAAYVKRVSPEVCWFLIFELYKHYLSNPVLLNFLTSKFPYFISLMLEVTFKPNVRGYL